MWMYTTWQFCWIPIGSDGHWTASISVIYYTRYVKVENKI
jgi:hypothetical protein